MKRVLFVCIENSNRSQMAEAFARLHGGAEVEALSAGSRPSGRINPKAVRFMAAPQQQPELGPQQAAPAPAFGCTLARSGLQLLPSVAQGAPAS